MLRTIFLLFCMLTILSMNFLNGKDGMISIIIENQQKQETTIEYKFINNQIIQNENEVNEKIQISDEKIIIPLTCNSEDIKVKLAITLEGFTFNFDHNWLWRNEETNSTPNPQGDRFYCNLIQDIIYIFTIPLFIPCFQGNDTFYHIHPNETINLSELFKEKLLKYTKNPLLIYFEEHIHYGSLLNETDEVKIMNRYNLNDNNLYYQSSLIDMKEVIHFYILSEGEDNPFFMKCMLSISIKNAEETEDKDNPEMINTLNCKTPNTCTTDSSLNQTLDYIKNNFYVLQSQIQLIHSPNYSIEILNLENNNTNSENLTSINFSECLDALNDDNPLSPLYLVKVDKFREESYINDLFYFAMTNNGYVLDLSVCESIKIDIEYPIKTNSSLKLSRIIKQKKKSIDVFNPNDPFFNNNCKCYSEKGTDVVIKDRRSQYYQNVSFCPNNCDYNGINLTSMRAKCTCNVKTTFDPNEKIELKTFKAFTEYIVKIFTFYVFKCFSSFTFKYNWGLYLYFLFIISQGTLISYTIKNGIPYLLDLIFKEKVNKAENEENKEKKQDEEKGDNSEQKEKEAQQRKEEIQKKNEVQKQDEEQGNQTPQSKQQGGISSFVDNNDNSSIISMKQSKENKDAKINDITVLPSIFSRNQDYELKEILSNKDNTNISHQNNNIEAKINQKQLERQRRKRFPKTYDKMSFKLALTNDTRTLKQIFYDYYTSSISVLNAIFLENEFSLLSIQLSHYLFEVSLDIYTNILLFNEDEIGKKFNNETISAMFKFCKTIISIGIAVGLSSVLRWVQSYDRYIKSIKNIKNNEYHDLKFYILLRFWIYVLIMMLLLLYMMLHVGLFFSLYYNSHGEVFKDFGFSFIESIFINVCFGIIICLVRYYGVKCHSCILFFISKIFVFFTFF